MASGISARRKLRRPEVVTPADELCHIRQRILERLDKVVLLDPGLARDLVRQRQEHGVDQHDEVWEGVYVVPPIANNPHQDLTTTLSGIFVLTITLEGCGRVHAGANVSDRRAHWEKNFRCPDMVVVLTDGRAIDCGTHWLGGPDFLVEIKSPGDETEDKLPFYSQLQVRELLVIHRDTRELQLYRHDGQHLVPVSPTRFQRGEWLVSEVVPLAFRPKATRGGPRTEVRRTDGKSGRWTV
jgi:Uma2 family endonuclease